MSSTQVTEIELDRERELRIEFDDGERAVFALIELRQACPCATCRGRRDVGQAPYAGTTIGARDAELHGNWGIAIRWSDGHDTGIYSWSLLRSWWDDRDDESSP